MSNESVELLKEVYQEYGDSLRWRGDGKLYWRIRKLLGLRICSLDHCNGDGVLGNGLGDQYFCACMSEKEISEYKTKHGS